MKSFTCESEYAAIRATGSLMRDVIDRVWGKGVTVTTALTLGSGLNGYVSSGEVDVVKEVQYRDLGLPVPSAAGHAGKMCLARVRGHNTILMKGRSHCYESANPDFVHEVVRAARALALVGVRNHIFTCAAGAVNPHFSVGQVVRIKGHINLSGRTPLPGMNHPELGVLFHDMTYAYNDPELAYRASRAAQKHGKFLIDGTYAMMLGPNYEQPVEIDMARRLGADLVGMSTAPEVMALRHMATHGNRKNLRLQAFAFVTNMGAGMKPGATLSHEEVQEAGTGRHAEWFCKFMTEFLGGVATSKY